jgi:hypothetical protein
MQTETDISQITPIEATAEHLLRALDAISASDRPVAQDGERIATRVRFAMARVDDLRRSALVIGGVFAPARLEVALSILETQVDRGTSFVVRVADRPTPRRDGAISAEPAQERREQIASRRAA